LSDESLQRSTISKKDELRSILCRAADFWQTRLPKEPRRDRNRYSRRGEQHGFFLGTKYSFPSLELFAAELPWSSMSVREKESNTDSLLGNFGREQFSKRKSGQLYVFPRSEFDYALNDLGMSLSGSGNPNVFGGEMLWSSMSFRYHHFSVTHSLLSCRSSISRPVSKRQTVNQLAPSDLPRSSLAFQSPKHTIRC
jgi:hypothetical protein